jgi:hypothetical protein
MSSRRPSVTVGSPLCLLLGVADLALRSLEESEVVVDSFRLPIERGMLQSSQRIRYPWG